MSHPARFAKAVPAMGGGMTDDQIASCWPSAWGGLPEKQGLKLLRFARAVLALNATSAARPVVVAWHIKIRGCDGSADWYEDGPDRPDGVPDFADALPMVYAGHPADGAVSCARTGCAGIMRASHALQSTHAGLPDFPGGEVVTMSPGGSGKLVPCLKCSACGHSVTA